MARHINLDIVDPFETDDSNLAVISAGNVAIETTLDDILDATKTSIEATKTAIATGEIQLDSATKSLLDDVFKFIENGKKFLGFFTNLLRSQTVLAISRQSVLIAEIVKQFNAKHRQFNIPDNAEPARIVNAIEADGRAIADIENNREACLADPANCDIDEYDSIYNTPYNTALASIESNLKDYNALDIFRIIEESNQTLFPSGLPTDNRPSDSSILRVSNLSPSNEPTTLPISTSDSITGPIPTNQPTTAVLDTFGFDQQAETQPGTCPIPDPCSPGERTATAVESIVDKITGTLLVDAKSKWSLWCNPGGRLSVITEGDITPTDKSLALAGTFATEPEAWLALKALCPDSEATSTEFKPDGLKTAIEGLCASDAWAGLTDGIEFSGAESIWDLVGPRDDQGFVMQQVLDVADNVFKGLKVTLESSGCASGQAIGGSLALLILGFLDRWIGPIFGKLATPFRYMADNQCPVEFPSASEANAAYLSGGLTSEVWQSWLRINNKCVAPQADLVDSQRAKLSPSDTLALKWRGKIGDVEYRQMIRDLGFLRSTDPDHIEDVSTVLPSLSELMLMLVRDAGDDTGIDWSFVDAEFSSKWDGKLADLAKQQGITREHAELTWRATKVLPSPTQIYDFLHRLDDADTPENLRFTRDDAIRMLKRADRLPEDVDRFIAVSHRLLSIRDIRNGFRLGAIDTPGLHRIYKHLGFSPDDIKFHVSFTESDAIRRLSQSPEARAVIAGVGSMDLLDRRVKESGLAGLSAAKVRSRVLDLLDARSQVACNKLVKLRFMSGELTPIQAEQEIRLIVKDATAATLIVNGWKCEKQATGKDVPFSTVSQLFINGGITRQITSDRLENLGYSGDELAMVLANLDSRKATFDQSTADKLARAQERINAKLKAESDKRARNAVADAKRTATARKAKAAKELGRIKRLMASSVRIEKATDRSLEDAYSLVLDTYETLRDTDNLSDELAVTAIEKASQSTGLKSGQGLLELAQVLS